MANFLKSSQSYMEYFVNKSRSNSLESKIVTAIKGTCNSMCPDEEIILRKKEHLVHVLEFIDNKHKLVKQYSRPAADTNLAIAHNLRPFHVLQKTVDYLLFEVTKRKDVSKLVVYNFVTDRLRAVRQDLIIQELHPELRITLLEPMIRFHVYFGYLLCEEPIHDYSPTLNRNILLECLKTCLFSYDELELMNSAETDNIAILTNNVVKCSLEGNDNHLRRNRDLVEALFVLTTLYDESPMWRLQCLSENVRHAPEVKMAYKLATAALCGHYATVFKYITHLCPLMFCSTVLFLPKLQRRVVQVLAVAYSCRGRSVPLSAVRAWLGASDDAAARDILHHYGLTETDGRVTCLRGSFRDDAPLLQPKKITANHLAGKMSIDYILTYTQRN